MHQANGSWSENALSYDCRSMLFKALHNMIEKYDFDDDNQSKRMFMDMFLLDIYYQKVSLELTNGLFYHSMIIRMLKCQIFPSISIFFFTEIIKYVQVLMFNGIDTSTI